MEQALRLDLVRRHAALGDIVLITGSVSWMEHGKVVRLDAESYHRPFAFVQLISPNTGRLLKAQTIVPYDMLASFGPQPRKPCPVCQSPIYGKRLKYCSEICKKSGGRAARHSRKKR